MGTQAHRTVFLRFRNNAAATAFVDAISNGLSGLYADSSVSIIHSLPPGGLQPGKLMGSRPPNGSLFFLPPLELLMILYSISWRGVT